MFYHIFVSLSLAQRGLKLSDYYDKKFHNNKLKYIAQCSLATLCIFLALVSLNIFKKDVVVIASLGASSFMIFTMPHVKSTATHFVLGGYLIGIIAGALCYGLKSLFTLHGYHALYPLYNEFFSALAIGLTTFAMVIFNLEHPPAAALALGFVTDEWSSITIVITMSAILLILSFRYLFRRWLMDLL